MNIGPIKDVPNYTKIFFNLTGWKMILLLSFMFCSGLLETVGVFLFIPLMSRLFFPDQSNLGENFNLGGLEIYLSSSSINDFTLIIIIIFLIKALIVYLTYYLSAKNSC